MSTWRHYASDDQAPADLQTLEQQAFVAIVTGQKPLDYFDTFVKEWKAKGGDQVTEDVNAWKRSLSG